MFKKALDEVFNVEIRSYSEIVLAVSECCQGNSQVFLFKSTRANRLLVSQAHLIITMLTEAKHNLVYQVVNQVFSMKVRTYCDNKKVITEFFQGGCGTVYLVCNENKTKAMILYYAHMNIDAMSEMKYDCTSLTKKDLYFEATRKRFSTVCIRHFC